MDLKVTGFGWTWNRLVQDYLNGGFRYQEYQLTVSLKYTGIPRFTRFSLKNYSLT
jgi:hypothetical protein